MWCVLCVSACMCAMCVMRDVCCVMSHESCVIWCDVMWCDVMWCDVMWCDAMWCDVMWGGGEDEDEDEEDGMHSKREPTHRRVVGKKSLLGQTNRFWTRSRHRKRCEEHVIVRLLAFSKVSKSIFSVFNTFGVNISISSVFYFIYTNVFISHMWTYFERRRIVLLPCFDLSRSAFS